MTLSKKSVLFTLFLLSGFCSLLYQVIWLRLAFASYGVITPILSVVVSVFMAGLFLGSWGGGRWIAALSVRFRKSELVFYGLAEAVIGVGAFLVPVFFKLSERVLLMAGESNSSMYLILSSLLIAASLMPWCIAMGTTFPFVMAYIKRLSRSEKDSFSYLYLANVIGAMCGTLLSAYVLIELLGFNASLMVAATVNFLIAAATIVLGLKEGTSMQQAQLQGAAVYVDKDTAGVPLNAAVLILFSTGFVSMAFEVLWTRGFTPVLKTTIYAFAQLLATYLLATWAGSLVYRWHIARKKVVSTDRLLYLSVIAGFAPVLFNDPRMHPSSSAVLISIFPFCALLGYLTPKLIDEVSGGNARRAGIAYAWNILGCILGPLFTSYVLLPVLGVKFGIISMAAALLAVAVVTLARSRLPRWELGAASAVVVVALVVSSVVNITHEERFTDENLGKTEVRRDHTATIVSAGEGMGKRLFVNGVGITGLTPITKVMAHLPLALHEGKPESALVICFGMGTTFRSLLSWGIEATAVELVPSVREAFTYYHADAGEVLKNPKGKIVVDDGRRFLRRTQQRFDVITIDPPPPVEAAASSLLHSEEFYAAIKDRLKPGGVFQQWFPGEKDHDAFPAVVKALTNSFPYIKVYRSMENWGYHFMASMTPLPDLTAEQVIAELPAAAKADLVEWAGEEDAAHYLNRTVSNQTTVDKIVNGEVKVSLTDDRPVNEYFFLRRRRANN